jgi:Cu(I)/Ag(I) efflux system membrane fusion protein
MPISAFRYVTALGRMFGAAGLGVCIAGLSLAAGMPGMEMPGMEKTATPEKTPEDALPSGLAAVRIGPEIQQRIGVTLGTAEETPLTMTIRSVGIVRPDETKIAHIHLKTEGWVEKLFVGYTGQTVTAGDPMLSIYSPAFFAAQREFLAARQSAGSRIEGAADQRIMIETARRRLELWDVPKDVIEAIEKTGRPTKSLILRSPISGR